MHFFITFNDAAKRDLTELSLSITRLKGCYLSYKVIITHLNASIIVAAYSQRTPTISYISQEQYKDIGGTAELVCSVQYLGDYPLIWMKQDGQNSIPISSASNLLVHDSRFSIRHDKVCRRV